MFDVAFFIKFYRRKISRKISAPGNLTVEKVNKITPELPKVQPSRKISCPVLPK